MKKFIIGTIILMFIGFGFAGLYDRAETETVNLAGSNIRLSIISSPDSENTITAFIDATGDTLVTIHADLLARILAARDSTKNTHADMVGRFVANTTLVQATQDTSKNLHADAVARFVANTTLVQATQDTSKNLHADAVARFVANTTLVQSAKDTTSVVHQEIQAIDTIVDKVIGSLGVFHEQADVAVVDSARTGGTDILDLNTASTRYVIRNLFVKLDDPGANTCTVSLEMLINNVATVVKTFAITTSNYTTYHTLYSMFGLDEIYGDDIHIYATTNAGTYSLKGQYSFAKTNN